MNKKQGLKMIYFWSQYGVHTAKKSKTFDPQHGQNSGNSIFAKRTKLSCLTFDYSCSVCDTIL